MTSIKSCTSGWESYILFPISWCLPNEVTQWLTMTIPNSILFTQQVPACCLWQVPVQPEVAGHALCPVPLSSFHCSCTKAGSLTPCSDVTPTVSAKRKVSLCHTIFSDIILLQHRVATSLPQDLHSMFCNNTCESRAEVELLTASPRSWSHNIFPCLKYFWFSVRLTGVTISRFSWVWVCFGF
jgi:hypothetical protein